MNLFTGKRKRADAGDSPDGELDLSSVKEKKWRTYGLEVLHQPEDESKGTHDIVFVHGLRGSIRTTWLHEKSEAHWPNDFIPQDLPNFRVFAFGYDANIVNMWDPASKSRITNHAQDLLGALAAERHLTDSSERMIIFVGHSLGGLIIQQALCASKNAVEDYMQAILERTYAIAFLGTPHLGADLAGWAVFGSQVMNALKYSNTNLLDVLRSGSEMLAQIQESFHKTLRLRERNGRPIEITCFYEQLSLRVAGDLVVNMQSAVLPAYPHYGIHANHLDMAKFETRDDDGYQTILKTLRIWYKGMCRLGSVQTSRHSFSAKDESLVQMFYACDYENRRMQHPPALAGTCQWLQQHPKYTQWKTKSTPSALWMIAHAGCGKSVLVSYLIDQLQKEHTSTSSVCYFFFSGVDGEPNDLSTMMCCILHQLFTAHPCLFRYAKSELAAKGRRITEQFATMWKIFSRVIMDPECPELYCLIDALDECECDSRSQLIRAFSKLFEDISSSGAGGARIRLFVTSQTLEFLGPTSLSPDYVTLSVEEVVESINNDVSQVIRARVGALTQRRRLANDVHHRLVERLDKDADQTFLWVALVLKMLDNSANASEEALDAITSELPPDLDGVYTKLLSQTSDVEMARKILHMVVAAFRPLTLQEINIALAIRPDDSSIADIERRLDPSIDYALRQICGPIIRITGSTVTLVHLTAKSFLIREVLDPLSAADLRNQSLSLAPVDSHTLLAKVCTQYLLLEEVQNDNILDTIYPCGSEGDQASHCGSTTSEIIRNGDPYDEERIVLIVDSYIKRYGFLDYSAKYWTQHYRLSERKGLAFRAECLCDQSDQSSYYTWFYVYATSSSMWGYQFAQLSQLMLMSYFGLEELAVTVIQKSPLCIDETDNNGWTALLYAAWSGAEEIVRMLLKNEANVNATGECHASYLSRQYTALLAAATNGHAEIVQLLKNYGADTEQALSTAATEGHRNVVATLLENGCDIKERNDYGQVPLHHACLNGRVEVFRFLVSHGADVSAKDMYGRNALDMAAEAGSTDIVKSMLSKKADVNAADNFGTTAFDLAHWFGHYQILCFLVAAGAKDVYYGSLDEYSHLQPKQGDASYNSRLHRLNFRSSVTGMDLLHCFPWLVRKMLLRPDGRGGFEENPTWKEEALEKVQETMNKTIAHLKRLD